MLIKITWHIKSCCSKLVLVSSVYLVYSVSVVSVYEDSNGNGKRLIEWLSKYEICKELKVV